MKTLITDYRGCNIFFDIDNETFSTDLTSDIWSKDKKSFTAIKKLVDDYIKENETFEPFEVESLPSIFSGHKRIFITGIRKDNRFIYEKDNGEKDQISQYNEKEWFLVNPENEKHFKTILELQKQKQDLDKLIKIAESQLIKVTLEEYKKTLIR